jgi:hypothetical protein
VAKLVNKLADRILDSEFTLPRNFH